MHHSVGEGEGGMFWQNSIEISILSRVKQITAQVGCMRQVLRAGALGRPRGMGWGGRREEGSGWGTHVNPWLIHVSVWQKPLQYCNVLGLQLIKINEKKVIHLNWISSNEVDETGAYHTEWSKPERKTPIQYTNAYIWNL